MAFRDRLPGLGFELNVALRFLLEGRFQSLLIIVGVAAGVEYAKTGKKVSGYTDTGVTLIANKAVAGVDSKDVKTGMDLCWGNT